MKQSLLVLSFLIVSIADTNATSLPICKNPIRMSYFVDNQWVATWRESDFQNGVVFTSMLKSDSRFEVVESFNETRTSTGEAIPIGGIVFRSKSATESSLALNADIQSDFIEFHCVSPQGSPSTGIHPITLVAEGK